MWNLKLKSGSPQIKELRCSGHLLFTVYESQDRAITVITKASLGLKRYYCIKSNLHLKLSRVVDGQE